MSNSNYSTGLQRLKPVHTAYWGLHNLAENWSWARDVNGRDRDETEMRRWYTSRDRLETDTWDRDHNPEFTETVVQKTRMPRQCSIKKDLQRVVLLVAIVHVLLLSLCTRFISCPPARGVGIVSIGVYSCVCLCVCLCVSVCLSSQTLKN